MMDIDFDELDRAVNSALAKDQAKSMAANSAVTIVDDSIQILKPESNNTAIPSADPVKIRKTLKEAVAEAMIKPEASTPAQPIVVSQPQIKPLPVIPILKKYPPVGRPDTGRVMDVLHAANDPRTTLVMPEKPLSQNSTLLKSNYQPVAAAKPNVSSVSTIMSSTPIPITPPLPVAPAPVASPQAIDKKDDEEDDIDRISNDITRAMEKKADESLSTPFLTNAKVDKRPLNAFMPDSVAPIAPITIPAPTQPSPTEVVPQTTMNYSEKPALSTDKANYATMMKPVDLDAPLPPELQSELLSVEADTTIKSEAPVFAEPVPAVPVYAPPVAPSNIPVPSAPAATNTATSIQPQYKEQPSSGEKNNGAIYDTKNYHKAIKTPSAIKAGGMWLVYFLILLVVGVAVGAAVFFVILPRL